MWYFVKRAAVLLAAVVFTPACDREENAQVVKTSPAKTAPAPAAPTVGTSDADAEVERQVRRIVADLTKVEQAAVKAETRLKDDLKADDLHVVELTMKLEEQFGIRIPEAAPAAWATVGDVVAYVRSQKPAGGGARR